MNNRQVDVCVVFSPAAVVLCLQ